MKLPIHKTLVLILLAFTSLSIVAQKKIFLDYNWKKTKESKAVYYRIITPDGSHFLVEDYFMSGKLQMKGKYTSKKLESESMDGNFITYYSNGQKASEGDYIKGKADGPWEFWYKDGQKQRSGKYEAGDKQGEWEFWHRNGALKSKPTYLDGENNGLYTAFYDNGDKQEEYNYSKGQRTGEFTEYFKGNKIKEKGKFVKDSLEGIYELFWENGNLSTKGEFSDNKRNGIWEFFHNNGKKSCEVEYKKGKFIKASFFDEEGVKLSKKVYEEDLEKPAEYTGGTEAMYSLIGKQVGKKVDIAGAKKEKYLFEGWILLRLDTEGNVIETVWLKPDGDDDSFEDRWLMMKNINAAIDDFPKFQPAKEYNRLVESSINFWYVIDFAKL